MNSINVETLVLYGSWIRGDNDLLSDRDVLLVDADIGKLCQAETELQRLGFSCSKYTWKKIEAMSQKQGLFLQHIKQEAMIIKDENMKFQVLLNNYLPKVDYSLDIEKTKQVVAITQTTSLSKRSIGWALDVLAVCVRNIAILTLANEGVYLFSYNDIFKRLNEMCYINREDLRIMSSLRGYKDIYRRGYYNLLPAREVLEQIQRVISRCFNIDFDSHILRKSSDFAIHQFSKSKSVQDSYKSLRLLESCYIELLDRVNSGEQRIIVDRIGRIIKKQNHYGLFYKSLSRPLQVNVKELFNSLDNCSLNYVPSAQVVLVES